MRPDLHPTIIRFHREHAAEMSCEQAASILGTHRETIRALITSAQLEASVLHASDRVEKHERRRGKRMAYRITAPALLAYIIQSANKRSLLMDSIRELLPAWEAFAQRIASGSTVIEAREQARRKAKPASTGGNVIPFDPACDLFPQVKPAA